MISVTDAQLNTWLAAFAWPLTRVLAFIMAAPVLGSTSIPVRVRVGLGVAVTLALASALPPMPGVAVGSAAGLVILLEQVAAGVAMGLALRLVFAAVQVAGDLTSLQMGLGFATFFNPQSGGQSPVVAQFLELVATLLFLALNAHLMVMAVLVQSFSAAPVGAAINMTGIQSLLQWSAVLFTLGTLLALPVVGTLLLVNLALGVLSRTAPQLNVFVVGFPVTLLVGLGALAVTLPYLAPVLERGFTDALAAMLRAVATSP